MSAARRTCVICGSELRPALLESCERGRFERYVGVNPEVYARNWMECPSSGAASNVLSKNAVKRLGHLRVGYYKVDFADSSIVGRCDKVQSLPR